MRGFCIAVVTPVLLLILPTSVLGQEAAATSKKDYQNCGKSTYYSKLSSTEPLQWTRQELEALVTSSHQNFLSVDDVFQALIELDQDPENPGSVKLIYSGKSAPAAGYGEQDTWTREHLWSDSRGAVGQPAFTDIHNNRPENTRVTMIKREMLYGECGTVEYADVCESPAFGGAPADTSQDGKVWMPPANVRGDIARALFYMELRYGNTVLNLTLSDCPPFNGKEGILSQLLEWHAADPVSDEEFVRNQQACQFWQGNRNPFVDYPQLVSEYWGQPQEIASETRTYPSCINIPTPAPTAELNECSQLQPGDIFIYVVESDDPDGVGFLALEDIPPGLELYMTDNPWTGTGFASVEGVVKLTVPSTGIKAGTQFGYGFDFGANQKWLREEGNFNIGTAGDSVFLYCYLGDSTVRPLVGYSNDNTWAPPGLDVADYGSERSALPPELSEVGSIILPHIDNYRYEGPEVGKKADLQKYMMDPANWVGNDQGLGDEGGSGTTTGMGTASSSKLTAMVTMALSWVYYA